MRKSVKKIKKSFFTLSNRNWLKDKELDVMILDIGSWTLKETEFLCFRDMQYVDWFLDLIRVTK